MVEVEDVLMLMLLLDEFVGTAAFLLLLLPRRMLGDDISNDIDLFVGAVADCS